MRKNKRFQKSNKNLLPVNHEIRATEVVLIDEEKGTRDHLPTDKALTLAKESELDLVLVAPKAKPPVAKIIDYGKYRYEQKRQEKKQHQKKKAREIKEIRLSVRMEQHDLEQRLNRAKKFLQAGYRLKLTLRFHGRENIFKEKGFQVLKDFANQLGLEFEQRPKLAGNRANVLLKNPQNASIRKDQN